MVSITLGAPAENEPDFQIWRAHAINSYAHVEQSLAQCISDLIGSDPVVGFTVFYQVSNARSRLRIFEKLIEHRHKDSYDVFLHGRPGTKDKSGLLGLLNSLDQRRNEIVHWHVLQEITGDGETMRSTLVLAPPAFWSGMAAERRTTADMQEFSRKATFTSRILNMFNVFNSKAIRPEGWDDKWSPVFREPCSYPPSESHPLFIRSEPT